MFTPRRKLLLVMEQCNPEWPSVPRVAWNLYRHLADKAEICLVTHARNRDALLRHRPEGSFRFIEESKAVKTWYHHVARFTQKGGVNWPLQHALGYPLYAEFNRRVYHTMGDAVRRGEFDAVMAATPILPRYPYEIRKACEHVPFILGPVNGGIPFPKGFDDVARKEFAHFNFIKKLGNLIPGYRDTYLSANRILSSSTWTRDWMINHFNLPESKVNLVWENGVDSSFIAPEPKPMKSGKQVNLIFAGRLVAYKGADMLIESMSKLAPFMQKHINLTIVGDGPEKENLQNLSHNLGLSQSITFTGKVAPTEMPKFYKKADVFCFPSIREFGGAVVMEAMAAGLPCVVAHNGGIGEYVTNETGIRIPPSSRESMLKNFTRALEALIARPDYRQQLAQASWERSKLFTWNSKADQIMSIIESAIEERQTTPFAQAS